MPASVRVPSRSFGDSKGLCSSGLESACTVGSTLVSRLCSALDCFGSARPLPIAALT